MDDQHPGRYISKLYRFSASYTEKQLSEFGLGSSHLAAILAIHRNDNINQERLSEETGLDKTTTSRIISKLVDLDLVVRTRDNMDKRINNLSLTNKGKDLTPFLTKTGRLWTEILFAGFSEEEKQITLKALSKMTANASGFKARKF